MPNPAIALAATKQERDRSLAQGFGILGIHLIEPVEILKLVEAIANLTGRLED